MSLESIDFEGDDDGGMPLAVPLEDQPEVPPSPDDEFADSEADSEDSKQEPDAEAEGESEEDAQPDETTKGEDSAPPAQESKSQMVPLAVVLEERAKRQDAERRLEGLTSSPPEKQNDTGEDLTDKFLSDPGAFVQGFKQEVTKEVGQIISQERLKWSLNSARQRHNDFMDVLPHWDEAVKNNPALENQMLAADDPAEFAYKHGKLFDQTKDIGGDLDAWREREREKIRTEEREALKKEQVRRSAERVIPTNAGARSAGVNGSAARGGETIDDLFDD